MWHRMTSCPSGPKIAATTSFCNFMLQYEIVSDKFKALWWTCKAFTTQKALQVLLLFLVISSLDYCNSILACQPACAIHAAYPECSSLADLQPTQHYTASSARCSGNEGGFLNHIKITGTWLMCWEGLRSILYLGYVQAILPSPSTALYKCQTAWWSQLPPNKISFPCRMQQAVFPLKNTTLQ